MSSVDHHIDVEVPLTAAYDEWTRFERLPRFMDGVDEVRQVDETHLLWRAERIAWRSTSGLTLGGVVAFHPLGDGTTRVMIMAEVDSAAAPIVAQRLKDALASFKAMMEAA